MQHHACLTRERQHLYIAQQQWLLRRLWPGCPAACSQRCGSEPRLCRLPGRLYNAAAALLSLRQGAGLHTGTLYNGHHRTLACARHNRL